MDDSPPTLIRIDRVAAAVRAAWRGLLVFLLTGASYQLFFAIDWPLMWRTDAISCAALVCVLALLVGPLCLIAFSTLRWLVLACWPGRVGVTWSRDGVELRMGPFGSVDLDRGRAHVQGPPADIPARFAADFPIRITHPSFAGNVADRVMLLTRIQPGALHALLVRHGWVAVDDEDEA